MTQKIRLLARIARRPRKRDLIAAATTNFRRFGIENSTLAEKATFIKMTEAAKINAPTIVDFVENCLAKARNGTLSGPLVFIGRNCRPLYHAALVLAEKYGIRTSRIACIDLSSNTLKKNPEKKVFEYIFANVPKEKTISFIDDGGYGRFIRKVQRIIRVQSNNQIKPFSFQMASLADGQQYLKGRLRNAIGIAKAVAFLGAQPHSTKRTERFTEQDGRTQLQQTPTSRAEIEAEKEIIRIIKEEALARTKASKKVIE